ncbi:Fe-S cluster assembly protein NifU [Thermodesulfobacteriota bacterium]
MWDYTDKVKDHFLNPRNVGAVKEADGVGEVGSLACGDALKLTFKLDENKKIYDAKFQTFGCASAIASSSALTEIIKGMTLEEAEKVTNKDIADFLGGLPDEKMHCSVMGREALEAAIANYRGIELPEEKLHIEGEVVCNCFGVTDVEIKRVIAENDLKSVEEVTNYTKAGGACETCIPDIEKILASVLGNQEDLKEEQPSKPKLTNIQKMQMIQETIERDIRPSLRADGGDVDLIDIEGNKVIVAFRGVCAQCPSSEITLKENVEKKLKEFVSDDITVVEQS